MSGSSGIIILISLAFVAFSVFFIFKQLQFVMQAVNLYKDMIVRLDKIIELLGNSNQSATETSVSADDQIDNPELTLECPFCHEMLAGFGRCTKCGNTVDQAVMSAHT